MSGSNILDEKERLLALEIRSGKMGFVVFEGPTKLLDWGLKWFGFKKRALRPIVANKINTLLNLHNPSTIVVRKRNYYPVAENRRFARIVSSIRAETRRHSAEFKILTSRQVRLHFDERGGLTKHGIATNLVGQFEELSWKLPHRRKTYESENPKMLIFDAAATGAAFFGRTAPGNGDMKATS